MKSAFHDAAEGRPRSCLRSACGPAAGRRAGVELRRRPQPGEEELPVLRRVVEVPPAVIQQVISLLPPDGADLAAFRFDRGRLDRLTASLDATDLRK